MKNLIILAWFFANIISCSAATKEEVLESEISMSKTMTNEDKVKHLMGIVEFKARYIIPRSQRELDLIQEAITEVINTPGHAEFFAEDIRRKQKEVSHIRIGPYGDRIAYDELRRRNIYKTMPLMPSPETIKVLGDFLNDDKDWPEGPVPGDYYANNGYAVLALKTIGLRNPAETYHLDAIPSTINLWQAWYGKVKAGEITFSFGGQPHEYRFNPDGTWVTIPLPQSSDSKKPVANEAVPETQSSSQHHAQENNTSRSRWIYAGVAFLILLITFTARKIITGKSTSAQP